ncbi:hypothetical protein ACFQKF_00255 [Halalkalicoccus sp. GCM10025322]|uniref:hypothetical protein n=1 Tax=Halalkalicoccus TaxID=332246 RepID=UPI002F96445E
MAGCASSRSEPSVAGITVEETTNGPEPRHDETAEPAPAIDTDLVFLISPLVGATGIHAGVPFVTDRDVGPSTLRSRH